jgi:BON domain
MSANRNDKRTFFRTGSVGFLAGCLWFSAGTAALAQENAAGPQASAPQAARTDADIQSDLGYALTHESTLQGQQVSCTTANGTVTLSGTVQTDAQRQQAETVAANVPGVGGILNNIKVTNPGSPNSSAVNAAIASQQTANTPVPLTDDAQSNVPPPPPDVDPNVQGSQNQSQAPPSAYNGARPPYQPQEQGGYYYPSQPPAYLPPPSGPVTIPAGTLLRVRLSEPLDTSKAKSGTFFEATAAVDIYQNGVLAIPRGAVIQGQVVLAKKAGDLGGSPELQLQLTGVNLEGKVSPLATDIWSSKGPNKAGYTVGTTAGIAGLGAIIGGIAGGGAGAALGAGIGAVGGLAASSATHGPRLILPAEAQVDFHLTGPVKVQPVSSQEAQRLASSVPQLVRRPAYAVPRPYPYPYYGYPYPYPYYGYPYPYYYGRVY